MWLVASSPEQVKGCFEEMSFEAMVDDGGQEAFVAATYV